jgi:hypothetical protein
VWITHFTKDFWVREDLALEAKALYAIIKCYADNETLVAFPSLLLLEKITGLKRKAIQKYFKDLVVKECIEKKIERNDDGTFKNTVYTVKESEAENLFNIEDLTKVLKMTFGQFQDLSKGTIYQSDKSNLITYINHILNNSVSIAQFLITDFDFNNKDQVTKLAKVVNKFKTKFGDVELRKIIFNLLSRVLNQEIKFNSIESLAEYLGGCLRKKEENQVPEVWELNTYE